MKLKNLLEQSKKINEQLHALRYQIQTPETKLPKHLDNNEIKRVLNGVISYVESVENSIYHMVSSNQEVSKWLD